METRTLVVIVASSLVAGLIRLLWGRFKHCKSQGPVPLQFRNGSYVPWGINEKAHLWKMRIGTAFIAWFAFIMLLSAAKWSGLWGGF